MPARSQQSHTGNQSHTQKSQVVVVPKKRAKKESQKAQHQQQQQSSGNNNISNTSSQNQQQHSSSISSNSQQQQQSNQQQQQSPSVGPTSSSGNGTGKGRGRGSNKGNHSRNYPRNIGLDFRKLSATTLMSYIDHHGTNIRQDAPPSELAVVVARHFENMEVQEQDVIAGFLSRLSSPTSTAYARSTSYFDGHAPSPTKRKRRRSANAARPEEQVAAKVTRTDENGSWILASVVRFYSDTECYDVQDEDDTSKFIRLPWDHVMRLSNGDEGCFVKGTHVMAIFPETTSFYRAVVSKQPVWKLAQGSSKPIVKELILKFEDDENEDGRTPFRRVPSRYVIPVPSKYFYEDDDDVDLTPPTSNTNI